MRTKLMILSPVGVWATSMAGAPPERGRTQGAGQNPAAAEKPKADDPVQTIVSRLDLERYKATIKGLTQFGDRREGTERNRRAVDWIEAQLKSYGCPTERLKYDHTPA